MISAVIVTYGKRSHILDAVILRLQKYPADILSKIIVVNNDSDMDVKHYERKGIDVVNVLTNIGSAGGYKIGLQKAYHSDCEFVWLLDDDNLPDEGVLNKLLSYYESFSVKGFKNFCLSCERGRPLYSSLKSYIGNINFPFIRTKKVIAETVDDKVFSVPVSPFGGMFFHKSLLDLIGYPNDDYFVYCDDTEFSYRITKSGGSIFLIQDCKINDIDTTNDSALRQYYSLRNLTHFKKTLTKSKFAFLIGNLFMRLYFRGNKILKQAVIDGYKGRLGKSNQFKQLELK